MTPTGAVPAWMRMLVSRLAETDAPELSRRLPAPGSTAREAAVLVLFGAEPDVLLVERSRDLRAHAGQVAFPGGARDPGDVDARATALREAVEETGVDPAGVTVCATGRALWVPPSNFAVTPVVAFWARPSLVRAVDAAETASVHRVPLAELTDPAHRFVVRHPSGYVGPGFEAGGLFVWGFTAAVLDWLLGLAGLERPWDEAVERRLAGTGGPAPTGNR